MRSYYTYGAIPDPVRTVRGFDDGGLASIERPGLAGAGGEDKPLMQQLYERGEISEAEYRSWLSGQSAGPSQEYNPVTRMPTTIAAPAASTGNAAGMTNRDIFGEAVPEGLDPNAPWTPGSSSDVSKMMASLSLIDPKALAGLSGFSADPNVATTAISKADTSAAGGTQGAIYEPGGLEQAKQSALFDPTKGIWSEGFQALSAQDPEGTKAAIEAKQQRELGTLAQYEKDYEVMKPLSDLLKANKFSEAFSFAQQNGVVDRLMDTNSLKNLRPAFTPDEMSAFFAAIPPDYAGGKFNFDPQSGVAKSLDPYGTGRGMQSGYPDPTAAFTRKDDDTIKNIVKVAMAAGTLYGGAQLAGLGGAGGAGAGAGAGAGTAGATTAGTAAAGTTAGGAASSGITGAIRAGISKLASIPYQIGDKVAAQLGLNLGKTGITALGNSIISGTTTAVRGGDLGDVLKSALLAAGVTNITAAAVDALRPVIADAHDAFFGTTSQLAKDAAAAAASGADDVIVNAARNTVTNAISAAGGAAAGMSYDPKTGDVTLEGKKIPTGGAETAGAVTGALSTPTTAPPDVEPAVREEQVIEEKKVPEGDVRSTGALATATPAGPPDVEPAVREEQVIEEKKVPEGDIRSTGALATTTPAAPPDVEPAVREEQVIEEKKVPEGDIRSTGALTGAVNPVTGQPDVTVEESKVPKGDIKATGALADILNKPLSEQKPPDVRPPLEEITVSAKTPDKIIPSLSGLLPLSNIGVPKPTEPLGTESKIKKEIEELDPTAAPTSTLEDLLKKYGTLENLLKVLGLLSASSVGGGGGTGVGGGGLSGKFDTSGGAGFSSGLTPVSYGRKQLSPDIDYYTYGTRPEAKFFEYGAQLEKPVQPTSAQPTAMAAPSLSGGALSDATSTTPPPAPSEGWAGLATDLSKPGTTGQLVQGGQAYWEPAWNQGQGAWVSFPRTKAEWLEWDRQTGGGEMEGGRATVNLSNPYRSTAEGLTRPVGSAYQEGPFGDWRDAFYAKSMDQPVKKSAAGGMIHEGMTGGLIGYAKGGVPEEYVEGPGSGRDDKIPALLSDGEYVIDAETLALLGDGSSKEGARRMDQFRAKIRQHKGRALSRGRISPNAKSPEKYMGGGLS